MTNTPARNSAQTAALEALIEAHATELKLPTVKARFRQMAAEATREQQTPVAYLAALLEAEMHERAERRERRRLLDARFPLLKRLEEFRFHDNPRIPQATIAALADGTWINDRDCVILVGDSTAGMSRWSMRRERWRLRLVGGGRASRLVDDMSRVASRVREAFGRVASGPRCRVPRKRR